jgi:uncharacterized protein with HEPN domain
MVEAIKRMREYVADVDEAGFRASRMMQDAVIRNLEVLGEAARRVMEHCPVVVDSQPDIPWREIYGMRNVLAHEYDGIDLGVVFTVVQRRVPDIEAKLQDLLRRLEAAP